MERGKGIPKEREVNRRREVCEWPVNTIRPNGVFVSCILAQYCISYYYLRVGKYPRASCSCVTERDSLGKTHSFFREQNMSLTRTKNNPSYRVFKDIGGTGKRLNNHMFIMKR